VLGLAGLPVAVAIARLPGQGGHVPALGLHVGGTDPKVVPGVVLAALATLGLGLVLGPETPLIAIGAGVAGYSVTLAKHDTPPQMLAVIAAAGSFAAISVIFGSPIVAAIIIIEASGLGGAMLPLILIPGLIAAGIGSLVFIGMANSTGLSTDAYALAPLEMPSFSGLTWALVGWSVALGHAGAVLTQVFRRTGLAGVKPVLARPFLWVPIAGLVVAGLAILFEVTTTHGAQDVLFDGQDQLAGLVANPDAWSVGALLMLMLCKGLAWGVCLSAFRGGPTFPAIFLGTAGGLAASHLPGLPLSPAVAIGMGAMMVGFLKLPLSSIVIATVLTASAGPDVTPLVIVGVVVAYLATLGVEGRLGAEAALAAAEAPSNGAPHSRGWIDMK
jgi:H+/Cl- antiporter ClcA